MHSATNSEGFLKLPRRQFSNSAGAAGLLVDSRVAWAQAYPTRPVRLIVPFRPGGGTTRWRLIGQWLSERIGQTSSLEWPGRRREPWHRGGRARAS